MDGDRAMSKRSVWQEQFRSIGQRTSGLIRRSLVDLALFDRHSYWDVEALDDAVQGKGIEASTSQ